MKKNGKIYKILSNFYYVKIENEIIECKARGKFKNIQQELCVGDNVEIELIDNNKGNIVNVFERKNELLRPKVANVDKLIILVAVKDPEPNYLLLDKQIIYCVLNNIIPVICISKIDKDKKNEYLKIKEIYEKIGYKVYPISTKENVGIEEFKEEFKNNVCVFAGVSGVGKSTLVNYICDKKIMKEGSLSRKLGRGKHTTRHVEIVEQDNCMIVDTPGFSSFDITNIQKEKISECYEEFIPYISNCEFRDCTHIKEEKCGIKNAVKQNLISKERYDRYVQIYLESRN